MFKNAISRQYQIIVLDINARFACGISKTFVSFVKYFIFARRTSTKKGALNPEDRSWNSGRNVVKTWNSLI